MNLISITGPESTGKSSLAEALADHYDTAWVREFSREYLARLGRSYHYEDIAMIARGQLQKESEMADKASGFLFADTDPLVCLVWSLFKYGKADPWLEEVVRSHQYDLYLLCDIDLPWAEDPLRENPFHRKELFDLYFYHLNKMDVTFEVISGSGDERLNQAISAIERSFRNSQRSTKE